MLDMISLLSRAGEGTGIAWGWWSWPTASPPFSCRSRQQLTEWHAQGFREPLDDLQRRVGLLAGLQLGQIRLGDPRLFGELDLRQAFRLAELLQHRAHPSRCHYRLQRYSSQKQSLLPVPSGSVARSNGF